MNVFVSNAEMAYEMTQVLGVHSDLDTAVIRCNKRKFPAKDESLGRFDRWWVEEWSVDGDFIRQYDVIEGAAMPQAAVAEEFSG